MSNPLSLLPIALAAGGGRVDGTPAAALVAAGFTLLQRSAPLVRALAGRRSAILLPPSGACLLALAASDGHGAVLLSMTDSAAELARQLDEAEVGAVFTVRACAALLPPTLAAVVLLDEAPRRATVRAGGAETHIDLGTHFGFDLEGEEDDGRDEECVIVYAPSAAGAPHGVVHTHRSLLAAARGAVDATSMLATDHLLVTRPLTDLMEFSLAFAAPLLAGARVTAAADCEPAGVLRLIEDDAVTMLVGDAPWFAAVISALESRGTPLAAPALRVCVCSAPVDGALQARWHEITGCELRMAFGVPEAPLCLFNAPHFPNRRGTPGIPFPGVQVSVRDGASSAPLATGGEGSLCVRGSQLFSGYVREGSGGLPQRDGWLRLRERARERPDGAFDLLP